MQALIEVRPHLRGWQSYESEGVAPFFIGTDAKEKALDYAMQRMRGRKGEIRVTDSGGNVEQVIPFYEVTV